MIPKPRIYYFEAVIMVKYCVLSGPFIIVIQPSQHVLSCSWVRAWMYLNPIFIASMLETDMPVLVKGRARMKAMTRSVVCVVVMLLN